MTATAIIAAIAASTTTPADQALASRLDVAMSRAAARALHFDAVQAHIDGLRIGAAPCHHALAIAALARSLAIEDDCTRAEYDVVTRDPRAHQYRANPWIGQTAAGLREAALREAASRI